MVRVTDEEELKFKICLVGEGAVGKTSVIRRFVHDIFEDDYLGTIGMKVTKKEVYIDHPRKNESLKVLLLIWDIMGQPGFRKILGDSYFSGASGILATCDVTRKDTLYALEEWRRIAFDTIGEVPVVFLGNKCDLGEEQEIFLEDIRSFSWDQGDGTRFLTSAKTGEKVESAFTKLSEIILESMF